MKKKKEAGKPLRGKPTQKDHDDIVDFINENDKSLFTFKQLSRRLNIVTREEKIELAVILQQLAKSESIIMLPDGTFQSAKGVKELEGYVNFVNPKFAYVVHEDFDEDIRVSIDNLSNAMDGDKVRLRVLGTRYDGKPQGEVLEIISRKRESFVGKVEIGKSYAFVIPDNKRTYFDIFINKDDVNGAKTGDKVVVSITDWGSPGRNPVGIVTQVLGPTGENDTEMHAILAEFGLPSNFPPAVEKEANDLPAEIPAAEIAKRKDYRNITTFTIDPVDAKDFDDAISYQVLPNGNTEVGIHIADVTYFVRPGTELEAEAFRRATSVYLVDRVVPMLPERLSNDLCSLKPNVDRLTFAALFEIDANNKIVNEWYGRTVIHSDRRFSYEDAQQVIETGKGDYAKEIQHLNEMALYFRELRFNQGAIGFESPEVRFVLAPDGTPLGVTPKIRKDAHKLIEEFMLMANKGVAEWVFRQKKGKERNTMVYRVHEAPNPERIKIFSAFAARFGYKVSLDEDELPESLNNLIEALEQKPEQNVLQNLAIRTMSKARYSVEEIGHFGLAFKHYSHFTSPIRRYPDMLAHRLLQHYLDKGSSMDPIELEDKCRHSSEREKMASDAERASIKYKQVEFMQLQDKNRVWEGIISGVTEWGFYVEIIETKCEGLVRIADLRDDYYELDSENYRLIGTRTKRIISFGDKVEVKVKAANLEKRTLDLMLVDEDLIRYTQMKRSLKRKGSR